MSSLGNLLLYFGIVPLLLTLVCSFPVLPAVILTLRRSSWGLAISQKEFRRPSLGFEATNLYATYLSIIEKIIQNFPSICNGVVIEKATVQRCNSLVWRKSGSEFLGGISSIFIWLSKIF
ncbi:uncharacterized protein LOC131612956 [Vicia villosa]|uniref:uncharacterized protein LOC131612953 n=1 Tax=Vicia villosa TaxID=3911 RepID=UPI00273B3B31|nr:uncharacterized protein LOC131612953 [Vicia villosa]XP_058740675.1 uncharacterized protein LOC131612956 [Vicia villosa]